MSASNLCLLTHPSISELSSQATGSSSLPVPRPNRLPGAVGISHWCPGEKAHGAHPQESFLPSGCGTKIASPHEISREGDVGVTGQE